jgi:ribosomal protein S18 acetylase RimI-like enzyme
MRLDVDDSSARVAARLTGVEVQFQVRGEVDDEALSRLHARAFGGPFELQTWRRRLSEHSLSWVDARDESGRLIGFVNVAWDGGTHAFALDVVVDPDHQGRGLGRELMARAAHEAAVAGCAWLHVDFEVRLTTFYLGACGFTPTAAGVLRLDQRRG